jgi:hypothetical protein
LDERRPARFRYLRLRLPRRKVPSAKLPADDLRMNKKLGFIGVFIVS